MYIPYCKTVPSLLVVFGALRTVFEARGISKPTFGSLKHVAALATRSTVPPAWNFAFIVREGKRAESCHYQAKDSRPNTPLLLVKMPISRATDFAGFCDSLNSQICGCDMVSKSESELYDTPPSALNEKLQRILRPSTSSAHMPYALPHVLAGLAKSVAFPMKK